MTDTTDTGEEERLAAIYGILRERILDLSLRNPMLSYKHRASSKRQLQIVDAVPEEVYRKLAGEGIALDVIPLPDPKDIPSDERTEEFVSAFEHAKVSDLEYLTRLQALANSGRDDEYAVAEVQRELRDRLRKELGLSPRPTQKTINPAEHARENGIDPSFELQPKVTKTEHSGRRLQTLKWNDTLNAVMEKIADGARLAEQEMGISTLFLAFGFLEWYESSDSSKRNFAPLLLLPVTIEKRKAARGKYVYSIVALAEGADTNLSLRKRVQRDFNRAIPAFQEDDETLGSVEVYFQQVHSAIEGLTNWKVRRWVTLGHFSFGRFAMYADLVPENWAIHPAKDYLVASILAGTEMDGDAGTLLLSPPDDYPIDDPEIERIAPILIHDADASQHSALIDVMKGKNLVVQGPPGTGKSQTITNIIANALSQGKTVLFIADKLAALEVVKRRLDKAGLGEFCLELHSGKVSPREVVESLKQRHKVGYVSPQYADTSNDITWERSRRDITAYLSALHAPGDDAETPFSLVWRSLRAHAHIGDAIETFKRVDFPAHLIEEPTAFISVRGEIPLYARMLEHFTLAFGSPASSPWSSVSFGATVGPGSVVGLFDELGQLWETAKEISNILDSVSDLGIHDLFDLQRLIDLNSELPLDVPNAELIPRISSLDRQAVEALLAARVRLQEIEGLRTAKTALAEADGNCSFPDLRNATPEQLLLIDELMEIATAMRIGHKTPNDLNAIAASEIELSRALKDIFNEFRPAIDILRLGESCPGNVLETIYVAISVAIQLTPDVLPWFRWKPTGGTEAFEEAYSNWLNLSNSEAEWRAKFPTFGDGPWPMSEELMTVAFILRKGAIGKAVGALTGERKFVDALSQKLGYPPTIKPNADDLEGLATHSQKRSEFTRNRAYREMLGGAWRGFDTPFKMIARVLSFRKTAELLLLERPSGSEVLARIRTLDNSNIKQLSGMGLAAEAFKRLPSSLRPRLDGRSLNDLLREAECRENRALAILRLDPDRLLSNMNSPIEALAAAAAVEGSRREAEAALHAQSLWATDADLVTGGEEIARTQKVIAWALAVEQREVAKSVSQGLLSPAAPEMRKRLAEIARAGMPQLTAVRRSLARLKNNHDVTGFEATLPVDLIKKLDELLPRRGELVELLALRDQRRVLESHGFGSLLEQFDRFAVPPGRLADLLTGLLAYRRAERFRRTDPILSKANGMKLAATRNEFRERDRKKLEKDRGLVRNTLITKRPINGYRHGPKKTWTEMELLNNEFGKERRFTPVRDLIKRASKSIQAMKPCLMMSPLSVAKFLPPGAIQFDLLVVDEASQMRPQEALGGLLRARQVIVVGDQKQLPPTDFFTRSDEVDDEILDDVDDESILEACQKSFRQVRMLRWHYRSRCESLISFSNKEFYRKELITFPMARPNSFSIDLIKVAGYYEARRNLAEAQRIAEEAIRFMRHFSRLDPEKIPSLGLVAVNTDQRDLIFEELRRLESDDELVETYRSKVAEKGEPVFVKNLENAQGDERDFIFISMTYGPRPGTKDVLQRFGPINGKQGHRRLNVLFTRARMRVAVFTSMTAADVHPNETSSEGVRVLKRYLEYVESRGKAVAESVGDKPDSDFEAEVADRLRFAGFDVELQVGVSGFKIDIGVRHPDHPTKFVAGVECDGATYHSSKSARDRDRLREDVLRGLGWEILRVWSTDWFDNPDFQTERLIKSLKELRAKPAIQYDDYVFATAYDERAENTKSFDADEASNVTRDPDSDQDKEVHPKDAGLLGAAIALGSASSRPLTAFQVAEALREFRNTVIALEMDKWVEHRSILREAMIETLIAQRVTDPEDWFVKIPQFQRSATNAVEKSRYFETICEIVARLDERE